MALDRLNQLLLALVAYIDPQTLGLGYHMSFCQFLEVIGSDQDRKPWIKWCVSELG